jgi:hypothetical protein
VDDLDSFSGDDEASLGEEDEPPNNNGDPSASITGVTAPNIVTAPDHGWDAVDTHPNDTEEEEISIQPPHPLEGNRDGTTRSGRRIKITDCARENHHKRGKKWVAWLLNAIATPEPAALDATEDEIYELFAHREYNIQDKASNPIAFLATSETQCFGMR